MKNPTIIFFGTPEFAIPALQSLIEHGHTPVVVTAPDKPQGRKKILAASPVKAVAEASHCTVLTPETMNDVRALVKSISPDICIIIAFGKIIPADILAIPKYGFVNIHPSLLPKYRGPSPIQTALLNGENQTGVSFMVIDEKVDHGPVIATAPYDIPPDAYYSDVERDLSLLGAELLLKTLPLYLESSSTPVAQDDAEATETKKFTLDDGKISWRRPAEMIFNQIRALSHEPSVWTLWNGKVLKIFKARILHAVPGNEIPGAVVQFGSDVSVRTGSQYLLLEKIQLQGSRPMTAADFCSGHPDFIGSTLS